MNDPWDVKSVRQPGYYISCMKINGVPILPPVLSQECRKEMKYYKLLAKEVEKRIALLRPYINDSETDIHDNDKDVKQCKDEVKKDVDVDIEGKAKADKSPVDTLKKTSGDNKPQDSNIQDVVWSSPNTSVIITNVQDKEEKTPDSTKEVIVDYSNSQIDLPVRDCDCSVKIANDQKKAESNNNIQKELINFRVEIENNVFLGRTNPMFNPEFSLHRDGPSSLSSKSFTGSLNDIHTELLKGKQNPGRLIRQRSYTVLNPSPQLLAHLEVQSLNTGVAMTSISMSESLSNLSSPKKRRSWDLESAKVKWSNMAMEMDLKNRVQNDINKTKTLLTHPTTKITRTQATARAKSLMQDKNKRGNGQQLPVKNNQTPVTTPVQRPMSPVRNTLNNTKEITTPKQKSAYNKDNKQTSQGIDLTSYNSPSNPSDSDDPATKVRELYEKIQKQQLLQMAALVEKQKREQLLLQQLFEDQNNLLYKQFKTICPRSPVEIKEAWSDKNDEESDRGPVSLSQLINHKSQVYTPNTDGSLSSTLTDTSNRLHHCEDILKKSRDISSSFKKIPPNYVPRKMRNQEVNLNKQQTKSNTSQIYQKANLPRTIDNKLRNHSPGAKNKFNNGTRAVVSHQYDTSSQSDRECGEPILTDRTNDTMADLNFTLTTDDSLNEPPIESNTSILNQAVRALCNKTGNPLDRDQSGCSIRKPAKKLFQSTPSTQQEREAATKIVAYAKGFLVRRLLRTERIQETVQTIRDALMCALQLHQDREGIRGADVDLHRRLIQQITAACYTVHDTFVTSTPAERCAMIAADRNRRQALASRQTTPISKRPPSRPSNIMSQSHSGVFPTRNKRIQPFPANMTQSNYETFSDADKADPMSRNRYLTTNSELQGRKPWR